MRSTISELSRDFMAWIFAVRAGWTLSVAICWLLLCSGLVSGHEPRWRKIEFFPPVVHVSPDYPARLVVMATASDGSMVDISLDPDTQLRAGAASRLLSLTQPGCQLAVAADAYSAASAYSANAAGESLHVQLLVGAQQLDIPVRVTSAESHSPTFAREVAAVLSKAGCNQGICHGNLHGKGGFRLSLRGDDPFFDFDAIARNEGGRRIDRFASELSLLLKKPSGQLAHQGGLRLPIDSVQYQWLERWIAEGSQWNSSTPFPSSTHVLDANEQLVSLRVYPAESLLASHCRQQQLVVVAEFADGAVRDVTTWAKYEASSPTGVSISPAGLVMAERAIDIGVSVSYLSGRAAARLTFLPANSAMSTESMSPAPTQLDAILERQLQRMQISPNPVADENVLLRRLYLTTLGRLPTVAEVQPYLESQTKDKYQRLVEQLLREPAYAKLWALRWSDLLRNEQKVMSPHGTAVWHAWMVQQFQRDVPLTEFVGAMLTSIGSTYENPPASFHRTHREPETAAETVGQVFLGVRIQCARCHNHPFDNWRQDDYYGLAAYFSTLRREQIDNDPKDKNDKHIITGDEIIKLASAPAEIWHPGLARNVPPKPLTVGYDQQLQATTSMDSRASADDPRSLHALAQWLTDDNRLFARNMANRVWFHIMGRGIVDPPDDFRDSNPASHPELLEYLTDELIRSDYSTRHLSRLILSSRAFRRTAIDALATPSAIEEPGLDGAAMFAGFPLRRMSAEMLYDAISDVTQTYVPQGNSSTDSAPVRMVDQPDVPERAGFLTTFGKPNRLLVCECERSSSVSLGQSLVLVNGPEVRDQLANRHNRLTLLQANKQSLNAVLDELYLAALTRLPSTQERAALQSYIVAHADPRLALEDILWALINSKEFPLVR
jgi:hypothetical protein